MIAKILLVDDNEINRIVTGSLLEKQGFKVDLAAYGVEALAACKRGTFDAIMTDISMPGMDGLELARAIRALPNHTVSQTPIIGFTAYVSDEMEANCYSAGMSAVIPKPFRLKKHLGVLEEVIRKIR